MVVHQNYMSLILMILTLGVLGIPKMNAETIDNWAVYYSDKEPISEFQKYSLIVFDSDYHPDIDALIDEGKIVLGYISLGEIEKSRWYYSKIKKTGILLNENKYWKGSYFVDVRSHIWINFVIGYLVPNLIQKGFSGIFIDTLDNPAELERRDSKKYKGMTESAVRLISAIRLNYPSIKIMLNRGYEILPKVAKYINYELGESIYTDYDFKTKKYEYVEKKLYSEQVEILKNAKNINPELEIFTLDYWNKDDKKTISDIYKTERANGFIPYVSTIKLNELTAN